MGLPQEYPYPARVKFALFDAKTVSKLSVVTARPRPSGLLSFPHSLPGCGAELLSGALCRCFLGGLRCAGQHRPQFRDLGVDALFLCLKADDSGFDDRVREFSCHFVGSILPTAILA